MFKSGAFFRVEVNGWGMNLFAETVDPGSTCGMCGNFNGNAADDTNAYQVNNYNALKACQKVCTKQIDAGCACCEGTNCDENQVACDIWEYVDKGRPAFGGVDALPPSVAQCAYEPGTADDEQSASYPSRPCDPLSAASFSTPAPLQTQKR